MLGAVFVFEKWCMHGRHSPNVFFLAPRLLLPHGSGAPQIPQYKQNTRSSLFIATPQHVLQYARAILSVGGNLGGVVGGKPQTQGNQPLIQKQSRQKWLSWETPNRDRRQQIGSNTILKGPMASPQHTDKEEKDWNIDLEQQMWV